MKKQMENFRLHLLALSIQSSVDLFHFEKAAFWHLSQHRKTNRNNDIKFQACNLQKEQQIDVKNSLKVINTGKGFFS